MVENDGVLVNPKELYNLSDGLEAFCFEISTGGYVIVNCIDGTVPEYSSEATSPVFSISNSHIYYNGPLMYFSGDEYGYRHTITGEFVNIDTFQEVYNRTVFTQEQTSVVTPDPVQEDYLDYPLRTFVSSEAKWWSPITAVAILLSYYEDYFPGTALISGVDSRSQDAICTMLVNVAFMPNEARFLGPVRDDLNLRYFGRADITTRSATVVSYSYSGLKTQIGWGRPVLVHVEYPLLPGLDPTKYRAHIVVAHGYYDNGTNYRYMILNDVWGHNNVWVDGTALSPQAYQLLYLN